VKDEEIKDRWREYFDKLFNGENKGPTFELDDSFDDTNRRFVKRMKGGKVMGPDGIPMEVWQNQPELDRLKYASPIPRAPTCFKRYNPLACRVTSR
jgi:hypothetical protein